MLRPLAVGSVALLACFFLTGCEDVLTKTRLDVVQDDRIVGKWTDPDDADDSGTVEKNGDGYRMRGKDPDSETIDFTLGRVGTTLFAQLPDKCGNHSFASSDDTTTCYQLYRLEFKGNELVFAAMDLEAFTKESKAGRLKLPHRIVRRVDEEGRGTTCALIEATPAQLAAALTAYPADGYKDSTRMRRVN